MSRFSFFLRFHFSLFSRGFAASLPLAARGRRRGDGFAQVIVDLRMTSIAHHVFIVMIIIKFSQCARRINRMDRRNAGTVKGLHKKSMKREKTRRNVKRPTRFNGINIHICTSYLSKVLSVGEFSAALLSVERPDEPPAD